MLNGTITEETGGGSSSLGEDWLKNGLNYEAILLHAPYGVHVGMLISLRSIREDSFAYLLWRLSSVTLELDSWA